MANYVRRKTKNGKEIARFYLDVMRDPDCPMNHRMQAAKELLDRSEGKAVERSVMVKIESDHATVSLSRTITDEELERVIAGGYGTTAVDETGSDESRPAAEDIENENHSQDELP